MTEPVVQVERRGEIGAIRLRRADAHNALDTALLHALDAAVAEVTRARVRVAIVSGLDRVFSVGADLAALATMTRAEADAYFALGTAVLDRLAAMPLPTIALVGGPALGGGFELMMACDLAVASSRAVFGLPEVQIGSIPTFGGVRRLGRRLGPSAARELVYTGRTITATRAKELGLVVEVVTSEQLAAYGEELAARIARNAPLALGAAKRLFAAEELGDPDLAQRELGEARGLSATSDWHEGLAARLGKRPAVFEGK